MKKIIEKQLQEMASKDVLEIIPTIKAVRDNLSEYMEGRQKGDEDLFKIGDSAVTSLNEAICFLAEYIGRELMLNIICDHEIG